jgi:deoxyribodipyrimidine photo-lyase
MGYRAARLRRLNDQKPNPGGEYVLYWCQAARRLRHNHALDYAALCAKEHARPLVVYEGLRREYPWASPRLHRFVLEGMRDNAQDAEQRGLHYWPFVETATGPGRDLLLRLAERAVLVVTDDFPAFIVPGQTAALARRATVPVFAVDGNAIVPLSLLGPAVSAAAHLRPRIHKAFAEAWAHRAAPRGGATAKHETRLTPPFALWDGRIDESVLRGLDESVPPVPGLSGGSRAGRACLRSFVKNRLRGYAESRSEPTAPADGHASGLSPYLHFGHVSIEEVAAAVLECEGSWTTDDLRVHNRGKREGFFSDDPDVNAFLDEALTWRDVGLQWHWHRRQDTATLETALPEWARRTLHAHASDPRAHTYILEEWEAGETHDPLWNAAQRELVATGTLHNYLRMLWGKKVIEWSRSPEEAYRTLVHLNNKYALDGRDPNSYTGILWCFGLFDRPWPPERPVLGTLRYMSSANTARKFDLRPYHDYVAGLPTIAEVRTGGPRAQSSSPSTNQESRSRSRKIR